MCNSNLNIMYKMLLTSIVFVVQVPAWADVSCDHSINAIGETTIEVDEAGTWCLDNDVRYTGNDSAIRVTSDNVTISFNDNRLDGPDSPHSQALGIEASRVHNLSIVGNEGGVSSSSAGNTISGFLRGISFIGGSNISIEGLSFDDNFQQGICIRDIAGASIENNVVRRTGGHGFTAFNIRGGRAVNCPSSPAVVAIFAARGSQLNISQNLVTTTVRNRYNKFYAYGILANSRGAVVANNEVVNSQNIGIITNLGYESNAEGLGVSLTNNTIWNNYDFQTFCQFHPTSAANDLHNGIRMSGYSDIYSDNVVKGFYQPFLRGTDVGGNYDDGEGNDGGMIRLCSSLETP